MANFYNDNKDLKHHLHHPLMQKIVARSSQLRGRYGLLRESA